MQLRKQKGCVYILWGERFNEVMATVFATQLRAHGWATHLIGLYGNQHPGRFGLVLLADLSLSQALADPEPVRCLVAPCPVSLLTDGEYDPRLEALVDQADASHALFVAEAEAGTPPLPSTSVWPKHVLAVEPDLNAILLATSAVLQGLQQYYQPPN
jgi:hypothetical protein